MSVAVRAVGAESASVVLGIVQEAFAARPALDPPSGALAEDEGSLAALLADGGGLVATVEGRDVGALVLAPTGDTMFLRRFGVVPAAQGQGVAGALVAAGVAASAGFRRVAVLARPELPATVAFWQRHGFALVAGSERGPYVELSRPLPRAHDVPTAEEMRGLGARVAELLRAGDLLVLSGGLGAGKTTFVQGVGAGLNVRGGVTSPTFVIARVHPSLASGPDLVHVDAYRIGGLAELDDLDLDTSLDDAVTVVEWGEGLAEGLAESRLEVRISRAPGGEDADVLDPRRVELVGVGQRWVGVDLP